MNTDFVSYFPDVETLISILRKQDENAMLDFLNSLDFEEIKFIQTLMYMGGDESLDFESQYQSFEDSGWASKEVEMQQITGKHINELQEFIEIGFERFKQSH